MSQKTGRNKPCPCGSGKKYKKCCLPADQAREGEALRAGAEKTVVRPPARSLLALGAEGPGPDTFGAGPGRPRSPEQRAYEKVAALSTDQLIAQLKRHGVQTTKETFRELASTRERAWSIGEEVWLASGALDRESRERVCMIACELWRRWSPSGITPKELGEQLKEGYRLSRAGDAAGASERWLPLWRWVVPQLTPMMRSTSDANRLLEGYEEMFNWIQDVCAQLRNAALSRQEFAQEGVRFCEQVIAQFSDEDRGYLDYFRCDMSDMLVLTGQRAQAEAILNEIIEARPHEAVGYVTLAGALTLRLNDEADRQRAAALLERALAYPVVDPEDWDLAARLEDLRREPDGAA